MSGITCHLMTLAYHVVRESDGKIPLREAITSMALDIPPGQTPYTEALLEQYY